MATAADREMARKINSAAKASRSLGRKAYISDVKAAVAPRMSKGCWAGLLLDAHSKGLVELARADLAINKEKEAASEVTYLNARFHFINSR